MKNQKEKVDLTTGTIEEMVNHVNNGREHQWQDCHIPDLIQAL